MPKSRVHKTKMFRDFAKMQEKFVGKNYLKHVRKTRRKFCKKKGLRESELEFLLWGYDLQFFTLDHAAKDNEITKRHVGEELVYKLVKKDMLYSQFKKTDAVSTTEELMYRKETAQTFRVRYALTQKARLWVQEFYRELEGYFQ